WRSIVARMCGGVLKLGSAPMYAPEAATSATATTDTVQARADWRPTRPRATTTGTAMRTLRAGGGGYAMTLNRRIGSTKTATRSACTDPDAMYGTRKARTGSARPATNGPIRSTSAMSRRVGGAYVADRSRATSSAAAAALGRA